VAQTQGVVAAVDPRTAENRFQWQRKPVLRAIYADLYRRMAAQCVPGQTLEIGGGSGNFKEYAADVVSSDIAFAPWLDLVADAQRIPFADGSLANIVMFDVLHHIEFPRAFFAEAARVLSPGGRIVMVEPAITVASWPFYRFVHPEPVRMGDDPLREGRPERRRDPFAANQAFPTLVATRHRRRLAALFPRLELIRVDWLSLFAYPLSGGFRPWSAIPAGLVADVLRVESVLAPWLGRLMGFRMLMVVEAKT
jgi:SAM-dependent methyltransferase